MFCKRQYNKITRFMKFNSRLFAGLILFVSALFLSKITAQTSPTFTSSSNAGCSPLVITFTNTSSCGTACLWDFGDGTTTTGCGTVTHTFTNTGCYDITLTSTAPSSCVGSTTMPDMICVVPNPNASFSPTPSVLTQLDPSTQMVNTSTDSDSFFWKFGDGQSSTSINPTHAFPSSAGSYVIELIAISNFGCRDTAYSTVVVEEELLFFVPNSFTPNGDEFNNTFQPIFKSGFDPFDFKMTLFSRWGEIIFETNDALIGWDGTYDGKLVTEGMYTWKIEFKSSKNDARNVVVGHLTILK